MSEANVPFRHDSSNELDPAARTGPAPTRSASPDACYEADWEAVPLPGMVTADEIPHAVASHPDTSDRAEQLAALVQDLKRCNEALVARVNYLETALETSQQALQQEVERSHRLTEEDKMAMAQQHSVAQLLNELEQSNAALKRQAILSETLQAQLETYQDRSKHLEKECAVLQKRHTEKAQKLQELEETCRDLRSRLQRQQRYTLQFKAALEKCLDASAFSAIAAKSPSAPIVETAPTADIPTNLNPVVMPRSERIQPWSATEVAAQADPQLVSLMRSLHEPEAAIAAGVELPSPAATQPASTPSEGAGDQDADQQLWQDVERIIENSAPAVEPEVARSASAPQSTPGTEEVTFTEPIPWGAPIQPQAPASAAADAPVAPTTQAAAVPSDPSNPSVSAKTSPTIDVAVTTNPSSVTPQIPALDALKASQASPSPIVHPLRPAQRKRKSLSAVELPSFPPLPKPQL